MAKTIMKTSLLCLILLGLSCVAFADVSPFYQVNIKVKGKKGNERRLGDLHGSEEQDSAMASILNSRSLNVHGNVVIGSKGRPLLGERGKGKGKGGFKYKNRQTSKSSKKSSKKGKGGKGKGGKGNPVGVIHNPIPTQPIAAPAMPPIAPISSDFAGMISGDMISGDMISGDMISGDSPNNPISADSANDAISVDAANDAISGDNANSGDTVSGDTNSGDTNNDGASGDNNNDSASGDDPSGDGTNPSGVQVLNFIMESTEVNSLDDQANFQLTTVLTLNGDLFDVIEENGAPTRGPVNLGDFRGVCTITGEEHYLCSYELYFRTTGEVGAGGIIIKGPVSGAQSVAVVTGTSFDYSIYDTGSVSLTQDPNERWLIARTDLVLATSS